ncbi:hypothetical protein AC249_AIPGENE5362 [Exaiptasia diaphana]|nr:hypothetical protein AC249_AIPGENE5362 [Exaiptasia diaphana]
MAGQVPHVKRFSSFYYPGFGDETQGYPSRNEGNIGKSFEMSSLPEIEDDNTKQSDRYTSYEELRRFNRNQWMQVSPRQPVNAQQPQNMKEERPALQDADDYHSSVDTYQSDISSSVWSEGSTSEQDNNIHKRQRATRPGTCSRTLCLFWIYVNDRRSEI